MELSREAEVEGSLVSTESKPFLPPLQDPGFDVRHEENLSEEWSRVACQADLLV